MIKKELVFDNFGQYILYILYTETGIRKYIYKLISESESSAYSVVVGEYKSVMYADIISIYILNKSVIHIRIPEKYYITVQISIPHFLNLYESLSDIEYLSKRTFR